MTFGGGEIEVCYSVLIPKIIGIVLSDQLYCEFHFVILNAKFHDFVRFPSKMVLFSPYLCHKRIIWWVVGDILLYAFACVPRQ